MPTGAITKSVRYRDGDSNTALRDALHRMWKSKCFSCTRPKDFTDIQIDHLIPKTTTAKRRATLLQTFQLPADFDLDRPANLAPICGSCNRKKANDTVTAAILILAMHLTQAGKLEPAVIAAVNAAASSHQIGTWLRQVNKTDLDDTNVRNTFLVEAPAIVQKLALLDPDKADFVTTKSADLDLETLQVPVQLSLNSRGRTAITVLDEILGCPINDAVEPGVDALIPEIAEAARSAVEGTDDDTGEPLNAGPPECYQLSLSIDEIDFARDGTELTVVFAGTFAGVFSGSVVRTGIDGDGLDELQGDSEVAGRFSFWASWGLTTAPGRHCAAGAEVTDWAEVSVVVWPLSHGS
jgi:hypothetical protein